MQTELQRILAEAREQLANADTAEACEEIRIKLLGKKGALTEILRGMGKLSPEEKKTMGQAANSVKAEIEALLILGCIVLCVLGKVTLLSRLFDLLCDLTALYNL